MSALIVGLWIMDIAKLPLGNTIGLISPFAAVTAIISGVISATLYAIDKRVPIRITSIIGYSLTGISVGIVILTTGHTASPFIVLAMLLAVFAGLYELMGFMFLCLVEAVYLTYLLVDRPIGDIDISTVLFVFVLPLVISAIVWRKPTKHEAKSDKAYSDLAKELSQVANKSEIVINAIADGVIAINAAGTIQLINPAAQTIMGWGKQDAMELDYRSVFRLLDPKNRVVTEDNDPIQQVLHTNQSITTNDFSLTTAAGKKMIISLLVSPVGQPGTGAIIVFRDITGDVAENRQKAEFVSTASHEMRTPVAAIEGYLGLALNPQTATIDEKARAYLQKAHESAQHLGQLFQDLLDVSKAEDGRLNTNPVPIEVASFVRDIIATLMPKAIEKNINLKFAPDESGPNNQTVTPAYYVRVDSSHYREVLSNLIDNAIKYTKNDGTATVDIVGDESHVTISIVDSGIGIPAEDLPHLFQKFYRVDNTDTREIGGTGLGLYLCRRLVEAMDGRIWVESEYGKGSMFFVELPRLSTEQALQEMQSQSTTASPPSPPTQQLES